MDHQSTDPPALYRAVKLVALLNLGYFTVEFVVARSIGSVSLFADSIDFFGRRNRQWADPHCARMERVATIYCRYDPCGCPFRSWHRDRMDGMGEIQSTSPPCCIAADADRVGRTRHQPVLRLPPRPVSPTYRKSDPCGVPLRPKRCSGKRGDH